MSNKPDVDKLQVDELHDFIDSAIDDMFVPRAKGTSIPAAKSYANYEMKAPEPPPPPPEEEKPAAPPPPEEEELDIELSWDQSGQKAAQEPASSQEDSDEAPKLPELRPLHTAMLSLDWEINNDTIGKVESALEALRVANIKNVPLQTTLKQGVITCKYLRASKSVATPLAITYLKEMEKSFELFLSPPKPGGKSPSGVVNELMALYEKMKEDANRLKVSAQKRKDDQAAVAQPRMEAAPPPPQEVKTVQPAAAAAAGSLVEGLSDLSDDLEQVRGRLRGAAAQGAPFAEAIDHTVVNIQRKLAGLIETARADKACTVKTAEEIATLAMKIMDSCK